jgi:hypothetical protein
MTARPLVLLSFGLALCASLALPPASAEPPAAGRSARSGRDHKSITEGLDCSACHTAASWKTLSDGGAEGFDHARTGFPLSGRHAQTACTGCHQSGVQITRACTGCHEDPHQRRLGEDCSECHSARSFQRVDAFERHRRTRLPLTGMHAVADCTDCHRVTTDGAWNRVPADCYACHADDYRRPSLHPSHVGTASSPPLSRNCAECHRATGFSPAVISAAGLGPGAAALASGLGARAAPPDHELRFPIASGPHRAASCDDCHTSEAAPRAVRCTGCHAHAPAQLRADHVSVRLPEQASCLGCHPGGVAR